MSRQAIWNKHEVALLIDTYSKVTAKKAEKIPALIELSRRLRNMAINAGIEIDDTYRNLNGMQWQYSFIEKAFQEKGIGSHMPPKLFLEMVRIYRTQPDIFNAVLLEAYKLSEDPVVAKQTDLRKVEGANMIDNKTEFQGWLQQQPRLKHPVGLIMSVQSECSDYAVARHISRVAFWDMTDAAQYMDAARKLQGLRLFRVMHRKTALTFDKTYIYYSSFLKEKAAQKTIEKTVEQIDQADVVSAPAVVVSDTTPMVEVKAPSIDDNIRRGDNLLARVEMLKSAFAEFVFTNMNAKGEVVERAIYIYPQGMERRGNVFFEIWHLSTEGQFDLYMKRPLLTNEEYQESLESWDKTNESRGRITRKWVCYEELIEYLRAKLFIARDNLNRVTTPSKTPHKNPLRYPFFEQVSTVLREHYPYGFRLESTIDIKRFRRYAEGLDLELPESDDVLKTEIKNAGVKIDDKVYLVEADTFGYISNTINALSSDGSNVLFYDCIYDSDINGMEEHHITSADFLKAIMKHCRQNIFDDLTNIHFAKNFLSLIGEQMERDAVTYEMQRVWGDSQTRGVEEISEQLPMIPEEYVRRYLSGSIEFVWVSDGVYFSMQRFVITEEEKSAIVTFVSEECDAKGYASISDVPLGNTADENYELTDFGLQEAIYNKVLVGEYRLNGKILTRENAASLDVVALAKQYLAGKEECTFDEMDKKVTEYAGTRYRYMAYEALYSSMVRRDKEYYVAHQYVKFDVDAIDEVLSEMIADRFVAIKEITSFALFPLCGFPWNHYLLESYCYSYSKKFCLKVIGFNDKNAGIIAENDVTDGYNELLSQAAARAKIELSTEAVGQYFFETGYMGKRKFSDLESIVERAKAIREDL